MKIGIQFGSNLDLRRGEEKEIVSDANSMISGKHKLTQSMPWARKRCIRVYRLGRKNIFNTDDHRHEEAYKVKGMPLSEMIADFFRKHYSAGGISRKDRVDRAIAFS